MEAGRPGSWSFPSIPPKSFLSMLCDVKQSDKNKRSQTVLSSIAMCMPVGNCRAMSSVSSKMHNKLSLPDAL